MIQEIHTLETSSLVDLLAIYTANYSRMLREGTSDEEFAKCSLAIRSIQAEIDSRKKTRTRASNKDPKIDFSPEYNK